MKGTSLYGPFLLPVERRTLREAPIMRGVAAGSSAERSGAATGGGGCKLPRPSAV